MGTVRCVALDISLAELTGKLGMARIFGCAPGLAKLALGGAWEDTGMPEVFQISEERLQRLASAPA